MESELTRFLCSVSSLHEAVHHKGDGSLWAILSSAAEDVSFGARDTHGCLVHLGDRVVISFVLSPSACGRGRHWSV